MLRPYTAPQRSREASCELPLVMTIGQGKQPERRFLSIRTVITFLLTVTILSSDFFFDPVLRLLNASRALCSGTYFIGDLSGDSAYWEADYPAISDYPGEERTLPGGENNIGFVVTLSRCPDDTLYQPGVDTQHDPGHSLYDAAAVLKHSIEKTLAVSGKYNATMHAIIHPEAITCKNPNGDEYDRVKVLESLGYYVNIQASPVVNPTEITDPFVAENIDNDAGNRDLTTLYAATYDNHPAVVMTDFDTIITQPLDPVLDDFIDDPIAEVAFSVKPTGPAPVITYSPTPAPTDPVPTAPTNPPTSAPVANVIPPDTAVDTGMILLKPNSDLVRNITDVFMSTPYSPDTGWNNTGVGNFNGSLGTSGILTHYYTSVDPGAVKILDHCTYGNDHSGDCLNKPSEDVAVAHYSTCGSPWTCPDLSGLPDLEKAACEKFEKYWYETRKDFEDNCWIGGPQTTHNGGFNSDVYLGFCNATGIAGYNRLITDKPAPFSCDPDVQENYATSTLAYGNGRFQVQKLTMHTGEHTGQPEICVSGNVLKAGFEPPYNICVVIDVSGSTQSAFGGTPTGDVNGDGYSNNILDAEIGSILAVLSHIARSQDLNNDNVNIGLVTFSTSAAYHGIYQPLDPNDATKINPALKAKLLSLRSGGFTHFDDALDKSIDFFQEAPADRSQLMFFLSDGIPNMGGDGDNEVELRTPTNNHISALAYNSELEILDNLGVSRLAVGVGSGSDIRQGFGLAMIDNTPDEETGQGAQQVTTTDELTEVLMSNPVVGSIIAFEIQVNGVVDPNFGLSDIAPGPVGFTYGELIVGGLDPFFGAVNRVRATVTVDYDGNAATTSDQHTFYVESVIPGMMQ